MPKVISIPLHITSTSFKLLLQILHVRSTPCHKNREIKKNLDFFRKENIWRQSKNMKEPNAWRKKETWFKRQGMKGTKLPETGQIKVSYLRDHSYILRKHLFPLGMFLVLLIISKNGWATSFPRISSSRQVFLLIFPPDR